MRTEDKFIITSVLLIGLFALYDIGHRAYDLCKINKKDSSSEQNTIDERKHDVNLSNKKIIVPIEKKQENFSQFEIVPDEEFAHGEIYSTSKGKFQKNTFYQIVGTNEQKVHPVDARQIERVWKPPMDKSNVKIKFRAMDDGTIKDIRLASSSGIPEADNAALQAIKNAETKPFKIKNKNYIDIDMIFEVYSLDK